MTPHRRYQLALGLIALLAIVVMLLATRWGIATSQDSASYVRTARDLLTSAAGDPAFESAHFPPGYSTALAIASLPGLDTLAAARWLHVVLLAVNSVIAAELVRRFTVSTPAALFVAAISAFSYPSIYIYTLALSEPLFNFFALLSLALLAFHVRQPRWTLLIASALLAGLGVLTRYAGWATVPAGAACLLLLPKRAMSRRIIEIIVYGAIACALPMAWTIRNQLVLGSATNRVIAWHPVHFGHLRDAARTAWAWLAQDKSAHFAITALALIAVIAILLVPLIWNRRERTLAATMAIFCLAFAAMLTVSISLVDAYTPVDIRILSPVYMAWLIVVGCLIADVDRLPGAGRTATWLVAIALGVWSIGRGMDLAYEQFRDGGGFANKQWRESPTVAVAKQLPRDTRIYTNAPGAMYLLTGRPMITAIPVSYNASSGRHDPEHEQRLRRVRDDIHSGRAVLVYLNRFGRRRPHYPKEHQLQNQLELQPLAKFDDGGVYAYVPARELGPATSTSTTTTTSPGKLSPATAPASRPPP